jgi:hypothetical protein
VCACARALFAPLRAQAARYELARLATSPLGSVGSLRDGLQLQVADGLEGRRYEVVMEQLFPPASTMRHNLVLELRAKQRRDNSNSNSNSNSISNSHNNAGSNGNGDTPSAGGSGGGGGGGGGSGATAAVIKNDARARVGRGGRHDPMQPYWDVFMVRACVRTDVSDGAPAPAAAAAAAATTAAAAAAGCG